MLIKMIRFIFREAGQQIFVLDRPCFFYVELNHVATGIFKGRTCGWYPLVWASVRYLIDVELTI